MEDTADFGAPSGEDPWGELDDAQLLDLCRGEDLEAFGALYQRHFYVATRLARHLGPRADADEVVSEAFSQILDLLRRGKGPDVDFRAYLLTVIRHESGRRAKMRQKVFPTDVEAIIDSTVPFGDGQLDDFERDTTLAAFESLPERWQTVLWYLDAEGRRPSEVGPLLDLSPNGVSALAYRARAGLRAAYLDLHVRAGDSSQDPDCAGFSHQLSQYVRGSGPAGERPAIREHLAACVDCTASYDELVDVNNQMNSKTSR